jgi:DNA-directed RNA polymerase subunit A'
MLSKGGSLHALLIAAGAPVGKKTDIKIKIPEWIFKSSLSVKREFLAALLGGDGPKPRVCIRKERKSGSKIHFDNLIFHKTKNMKKNIIGFSNDIKKLFGEFGITIKKIIIEDDYIRKDGSNILKCKIVFSTSNLNISKLLNKIGYRYCMQKEKESRYLGEWLRLREFAIKEKIKFKNRIKGMYKNGFAPKKISDILKIKYRDVNRWLFEEYKCKNTRLTQRMLLPYEKWLENSKLNESCAVWEKVVKKEIKELNDVRDFTTTENTHSFIANGFITHNCPIETPEGTPIGLRKNLALLCKISQEELSEEKLKKQLEGYGLKK